MAAAFPNSRFTDYDFSGEAVANANADTQLRKLGNIEFQVKDAATLDECDRYDLITTFDTVHDQAKPDVMLQNIYHTLHPDGVYLMQDIHAATGVRGNLDRLITPLLYTISYALHERFACLWWYGARRNLGQRKSAGAAG